MDYRNERDALRGRVENLEQQLDEAKGALLAQHDEDRAARVADLEQQLAAALDALREVRQELAETRAAREAPSQAAERGAESTTPLATGSAKPESPPVLVWSWLLSPLVVFYGLIQLSTSGRLDRPMHVALTAFGVASFTASTFASRFVMKRRRRAIGLARLAPHAIAPLFWTGLVSLLVGLGVLVIVTARSNEDASGFSIGLAAAWGGWAEVVVFFVLSRVIDARASRERSRIPR